MDPAQGYPAFVNSPTFVDMPLPNIHFYFQDTMVSLAERTRLKIFIQKLLQKHGRRIVQLNYIFCTDQALRKINKTHLNHNYFTDIVSFDLSKTKKDLEAEIYISVDRVRENAKTYDTTIRKELHRVIFHGILHLCGYQDKLPEQQIKMRKLEEKYLTNYFTAP